MTVESAEKKKKWSPLQMKAEIEYLERIKEYEDQVVIAHPDSKQEGFEFLFSQMAGLGSRGKLRALLYRGKGSGITGRARIMRIFMKNVRNMMKSIRECFADLEPYFEELGQAMDFQSSSTGNFRDSYPNKELWTELEDYAREKWGLIKIGFTELPEQLIFKDKAVLFRHTLVFIEEMHKNKIDQAPDITAGAEVIRVYKTLGIAVNDIACWLREKGIRCQSNHPLGGLVNTPPLAGKAGMGWQGHNGLLITSELGQRQRIAPIFIEEKIFDYTDNDDHRWIEDYCQTCKRCQKKCPTQAIYDERVVSIDNIPGIGATRTCIDRTKCFPYFNQTLGCSVCIKVCPFSKGPEMYSKLKEAVERKKNGLQD